MQKRKLLLMLLTGSFLMFLSLNCSKGTDIEWIKVEGGTFQMGSNDGQKDEKPAHTVVLDTYYISKYEITFAQFDNFCDLTDKDKPSDNGWGRRDRPVINVSWYDAVAFCNWLSKKTGKNIHLPTEAQWEFAAKGGNKSRGYKYSGSDNLVSVACGGVSLKKTLPVGQKQSNELGIYNMSGNVLEMCLDWYGENYYSIPPEKNPQGPLNGPNRVGRGGSWDSSEISMRSTTRDCGPPAYRGVLLGFRIVLSDKK